MGNTLDLLERNGVITDIETQEITCVKSQFRSENYQKQLRKKFKGWGFDIGFTEKYDTTHGIINIVYDKNKFSSLEAKNYVITDLPQA
jgi:hypothetical protein